MYLISTLLISVGAMAAVADNWINTDLKTVVTLGTTTVRVSSTVSAKATTATDFYYIAVPIATHEKLAFFTVNYRKDMLRPDQEFIKKYPHFNQSGFHYYRVAIGSIKKDESISLKFNQVFTHSSRPKPAEALQSEPLAYEWNGLSIFPSPYKSNIQNTLIKY